MDARAFVESIGREVEGAKGTRIWDDFINALNLVSQVVFTRSSGFILELLQNAEDAGLSAPGPGLFRIRLRRDGITIQHNGDPFSPENVQAISGIRSSKKPERGTLGYLGIGFKSVFKVSDCPEIYSGEFKFKFDRDAWPRPTETPWHVIPIWIQEASKSSDPALTTFHIPFRDGATYEAMREELKSIRVELFLFLRWIKTIEIIDEPSGESWALQNLGEDQDGVSTVQDRVARHRFKFFRRSVHVPVSVKQDRLTQQYRARVTSREVAIAFEIDESGNLAPNRAGAMYGGVYSFIPLGEASSGAKFPIQADFLVQPGRDAINYEAPWNHWLLSEVSDLCKEAISAFKSDERWRFQFLPAFDFSKSPGLEPYEKLFGPRLIAPLEDFLGGEACIPAADGRWVNRQDAIRIGEDRKARAELESLLLPLGELAEGLAGDASLVVADTRLADSADHPIKTVDRRDLLRNAEFLVSRASRDDGPTWFRSLYRWLSRNPVRIVWATKPSWQSGRRWMAEAIGLAPNPTMTTNSFSMLRDSFAAAEPFTYRNYAPKTHCSTSWPTRCRRPGLSSIPPYLEKREIRREKASARC